MSRIAAALIRLYPRDWRRRYGAEMAEMVAAQPMTLRAATDLLAGAIDARLYPQWTRATASAGPKGTTMTTGIFRCAPAGVSRQDQWRSAAWLVGGSAALMTLSLALQQALGPNRFSEALLYGAFPAALMLSNECSYFKPYSRAARFTMAVGGALLILLLMWASVTLAYRI